MEGSMDLLQGTLRDEWTRDGNQSSKPRVNLIAILVYEVDIEGRASLDRWPVGCEAVQFGTRTEV